MTIRYDFTPNATIAWLDGEISDEDIVAVNRMVYTHEYSGQHTFHLVDLSGVTNFNVSFEVLERLAEIDRQESKKGPLYCCIVAPSDLNFGMGRAWGFYSDEDDFHSSVVRTQDEAITWFSSNGIDASFLKS